MSYYDNDPYYSPEKFDLEIIDSLEFSDAYYQFDMRVVWRHTETGKFYTARDSGCSCPAPFENYNSLDDLDELTDWTELQAEVDSAINDLWNSNPDIAGEGASFVGKVREAMIKDKRTLARG
jgi:hypothetical protein